MNRAAAVAETAARPLLWALALVNLLFVLAFCASLLLLAGKAQAQTAYCTGNDLLPGIERDTPEKMAQMRAEAARIPNGKGLLWRIEKDGVAASHLFGTMHMTDPRVVSLPDEAKTVFENASTVIIETTDVLDNSKLMAVMAAAPDLMMFTDATTLTSLLGPEDSAMVEAGLKARGISLAAVNKMKPWMLSAMVSLPACELARKAGGAPILDINLANLAKKAGKTVGGLETGRSQLEAMASLPLDFHIEGLIETLKLGDSIDDMIETMISLYIQGETGMFMPFLRLAMPGSSGGPGYAAFEERLINARNVTMVLEAKAFLDRGNAFIAVGALHLPGEKGVIEELRRSGYTVTPAG